MWTVEIGFVKIQKYKYCNIYTRFIESTPCRYCAETVTASERVGRVGHLRQLYFTRIGAKGHKFGCLARGDRRMSRWIPRNKNKRQTVGGGWKNKNVLYTSCAHAPIGERGSLRVIINRVIQRRDLVA